jgi:hypothetical protein
MADDRVPPPMPSTPGTILWLGGRLQFIAYRIDVVAVTMAFQRISDDEAEPLLSSGPLQKWPGGR